MVTPYKQLFDTSTSQHVAGLFNEQLHQSIDFIGSILLYPVTAVWQHPHHRVRGHFSDSTQQVGQQCGIRICHDNQQRHFVCWIELPCLHTSTVSSLRGAHLVATQRIAHEYSHCISVLEVQNLVVMLKTVTLNGCRMKYCIFFCKRVLYCWFGQLRHGEHAWFMSLFCLITGVFHIIALQHHSTVEHRNTLPLVVGNRSPVFTAPSHPRLLRSVMSCTEACKAQLQAALPTQLSVSPIVVKGSSQRARHSTRVLVVFDLLLWHAAAHQ